MVLQDISEKVSSHRKSISKGALTLNIEDEGMRSLIWRNLLGLLPDDHSEWEPALLKQVNDYKLLKTSLIIKVDDVNIDPLSASTSSSSQQSQQNNHNNAWNNYYDNVELTNFIKGDLDRLFITGIDDEYFLETNRRQLLLNVLLIWSLSHKQLSYRQGMHEIAAIILYVLEHEKDYINQSYPHYNHIFHMDTLEGYTYTLFDRIMQYLSILYDPESSSTTRIPHTCISEIIENTTTPYTTVTVTNVTHDHADKSNEQVIYENHPKTTIHTITGVSIKNTYASYPPIVHYCTLIQEHCLRQIDFELCQFLETCSIPGQLYGIKWCRLLFCREFNVSHTICLRLWDYLFAYLYYDEIVTSKLDDHDRCSMISYNSTPSEKKPLHIYTQKSNTILEEEEEEECEDHNKNTTKKDVTSSSFNNHSNDNISSNNVDISSKPTISDETITSNIHVDNIIITHESTYHKKDDNSNNSNNNSNNEEEIKMRLIISRARYKAYNGLLAAVGDIFISMLIQIRKDLLILEQTGVMEKLMHYNTTTTTSPDIIDDILTHAESIRRGNYLPSLLKQVNELIPPRSPIHNPTHTQQHSHSSMASSSASTSSSSSLMKEWKTTTPVRLLSSSLTSFTNYTKSSYKNTQANNSTTSNTITTSASANSDKMHNEGSSFSQDTNTSTITDDATCTSNVNSTQIKGSQYTTTSSSSSSSSSWFSKLNMKESLLKNVGDVASLGSTLLFSEDSSKKNNIHSSNSSNIINTMKMKSTHSTPGIIHETPYEEEDLNTHSISNDPLSVEAISSAIDTLNSPTITTTTAATANNNNNNTTNKMRHPLETPRTMTTPSPPQQQQQQHSVLPQQPQVPPPKNSLRSLLPFSSMILDDIDAETLFQDPLSLYTTDKDTTKNTGSNVIANNSTSMMTDTSNMNISVHQNEIDHNKTLSGNNQSSSTASTSNSYTQSATSVLQNLSSSVSTSTVGFLTSTSNILKSTSLLSRSPFASASIDSLNHTMHHTESESSTKEMMKIPVKEYEKIQNELKNIQDMNQYISIELCDIICQLQLQQMYTSPFNDSTKSDKNLEDSDNNERNEDINNYNNNNLKSSSESMSTLIQQLHVLTSILKQETTVQAYCIQYPHSKLTEHIHISEQKENTNIDSNSNSGSGNDSSDSCKSGRTASSKSQKSDQDDTNGQESDTLGTVSNIKSKKDTITIKNTSDKIVSNMNITTENDSSIETMTSLNSTTTTIQSTTNANNSLKIQLSPVKSTIPEPIILSVANESSDRNIKTSTYDSSKIQVTSPSIKEKDQKLLNDKYRQLSEDDLDYSL